MSDVKKVYLLMAMRWEESGSVGEVVAAFRNEVDAESHKDFLNSQRHGLNSVYYEVNEITLRG